MYFGTDDKTFARAERLVMKELRDAREERLGVVTLKQAKQQIIGQIALGAESGAGWMSTMGKSILMYDRVRPLEEAFHAIEAVTADDVLEVANEILDPDRLSALVYFPAEGLTPPKRRTTRLSVPPRQLYERWSKDAGNQYLKGTPDRIAHAPHSFCPIPLDAPVCRTAPLLLPIRLGGSVAGCRPQPQVPFRGATTGSGVH